MLTSKQARLIRAGLMLPPCQKESCSCQVDLFVPSTQDSLLEKQLPEEKKPSQFDNLKIDDMRKASEFFFARDELAKIDAAKRLQNTHVFELGKKYYRPKK